MRKATVEYIIIKRLDHYGCEAIPTGRIEGDTAEFRLIYCPHNPIERLIWLRREDI